MLVSFTGEETPHGRSDSSEDYCSCQSDGRYKVAT